MVFFILVAIGNSKVDGNSSAPSALDKNNVNVTFLSCPFFILSKKNKFGKKFRVFPSAYYGYVDHSVYKYIIVMRSDSFPFLYY